MKIADLDTETKALIVSAHHLLDFPSEEATERLRRAIVRFDEKHSEEREANLLNALGPAPAPATSAEPLRTEIIREIELEREAQDVKWGGPEHDDTHRREDWTHYIQRHTDIAFGDRFRKQMIRVAALAIAAIESDARAALRQPGTPAPTRGEDV